MSTYQNRTIAVVFGALSLASLAVAQTVTPVKAGDDEDIVAQTFEEAPAAVIKATPQPKPAVIAAVPAIAVPVEIVKAAETAKPSLEEAKLPAPGARSQSRAEDIGATAAVETHTLLLPPDASAHPLPAAKPFAKETPTYKWTNAPLAQVMDEIARANGLTIQVILPDGVAPTVTGDFSGKTPKDMIREIATATQLTANLANGAFTIKPADAVIAAAAKVIPVVNVREFAVPNDESADFNKAFAKAKQVGRLTLLGSDASGSLLVRVTDTPEALDNLTREFNSSRIKAVAPAPVKPIVIDVKIEAERKKLLNKRERLVNDYIAESH